jgi:glycosyltransferase involved in cell wall biosynthesis
MTTFLLLLCAVPAWIYAGYPLLLWLLGRATRRPARRAVPPGFELPRVALLVTARNEARDIGARLRNALGLDYPADRLQIVVASDGSTDGTDAIVRSFARRGVRLVRATGAGKSSAQNAAFPHLQGDVVVFSDANVAYRPDALRRLVEPFADPSVGGTVGRVAYVNRDRTPVAAGEGLYWRYELALRALESRAGILAMGSGPIMAVRREFLGPLHAGESEDFALPLRIALAGKRNVYVPDAVSEEFLYQDRAWPMYHTRVRIVGKDLRTLLRYPSALAPWRAPLLALGLVSHKLLRWSVGCVALALLAASAAGAPSHAAAAWMLALQLAGYALAAWGGAGERGLVPAPRLATTAFFFVLVNAAGVHGLLRGLAGKAGGRWDPVRRDDVQATGAVLRAGTAHAARGGEGNAWPPDGSTSTGDAT